MKEEDFKRHKKAFSDDLNNIKRFSMFEYGRFYGLIDINKIWLDMTDIQFKELRKLIDYNFTKCYSNWSGKRIKELKEVLGE